jgi:probable biosynthetic protein (TIGR04098 family)
VFFDTPADAKALWAGPQTFTIPINPDRDINGVGLVFFANFVTFMDAAERRALEGTQRFEPRALDGRSTVRRRIGYYANALPSDAMLVEVEGFALASGSLLFHHRVRRASDGRLCSIASAEKRLLAAEGETSARIP